MGNRIITMDILTKKIKIHPCTLLEAAEPDCEGDEDEVGDCTDCPVDAIGRISTDSTAPPPGV